MVQQRLLAASPYPGDLVERRVPQRLGPLGTVRANRKAVRLVPQALQEIEHRVARVEREWCTARDEEALAPSIALWSLGDSGDRDVGDTEFFEDALRHVELALAAVDHNEIGPGAPVAFRILLEGPRKAALMPHLLNP
jgi:hypothetical protein